MSTDVTVEHACDCGTPLVVRAHGRRRLNVRSRVVGVDDERGATVRCHGCKAIVPIPFRYEPERAAPQTA